jgi:ABC-2 type transport system permease protein
MNSSHLRTFVWLRWRLAVNQFKRSGPGGAVVSAIVTVLIAGGGLFTLIAGFFIGLLALRTGTSDMVMAVWDGAIVGFVFFWLIGLMSELQRSDVISLDRFLHLPVSPTGAFLINYLGSSVSLALVLLLPGMIGLAAGLVLSRGPLLLLLFPLVAAFFLMMTAVTYQFRGWLDSLMRNPRRRRTIITVVPFAFILMLQLPGLWNLGPWARERREARVETRRAIARLDDELAAGRITREEYARRRPAPPAESVDDNLEAARLFNLIAPPGWLAHGAAAAADGRAWPALAGAFGMALIGTLSLKRAYGTTLRLYRGDFDRGRRAAVSARPIATPARDAPAPRSASLIEGKLPWLSDSASGVAAASLRSWMRAPEMKMTLLTPVFVLIVFSRMLAGQNETTPELLRLLTTIGLAATMLVFGMVGPIGNQFAYDRAGFRAFVLCPIARRDVLLGKNLSLLPFALAMMAVMVGVSQWFNPMRLDHLVAVLIHLVSMYLVFCLAANLLSILCPIALKSGSGMPAPHQGLRGILPLLFMLGVSIPLGLTLFPLAIEALLRYANWFAWFPAYLVVGVVQAIVMLWVYRAGLDWEGRLLQRRERQILDIVAARD